MCMASRRDNLIVVGGQQGAASPGADADTQIMLAEYSALRAQADRRANVQWNVFALQITSAGVISSLAISHVSDIALLLVVPLSSYMLGSRYILHDFHIRLISMYIRDKLSPSLRGRLNWEGWEARRTRCLEKASPWLAPIDWNVRHPTRVAFEGLGLLALLAAAFAAVYVWRDKTPEWYLILGFALLWALGALATYSLHRSFNWCRSVGHNVQCPQGGG